MGFYNTNQKFDSTLIDKMGGTGKALGYLGQSLSDVEKDKVSLDKERSIADYYKQEAVLNTDKNNRENEKEKRIIEEASRDKNKMTALEDGLIKAYENKHPIFMGMKTKDGKENPEYKNMTREDKLALIKIVGEEQSSQKSPDVVNVTTREDGERVAIFKDGSIKPLGFKAKDYNTPSSKKDKEDSKGWEEDVSKKHDPYKNGKIQKKFGDTATLKIDDFNEDVEAKFKF